MSAFETFKLRASISVEISISHILVTWVCENGFDNFLIFKITYLNRFLLKSRLKTMEIAQYLV